MKLSYLLGLLLIIHVGTNSGCRSGSRVPFEDHLGLHPGMPMADVEDSLRSNGLTRMSADNAFSVDVKRLAGIDFLGIHLHDSDQFLAAFTLVSVAYRFSWTVARYDTLFHQIVAEIGLPAESRRSIYEGDSANHMGSIYSLLHSRWHMRDKLTSKPLRIDLYIDRWTQLINLMVRLEGWYGDEVFNPRYELGLWLTK